MRKTHLAGVAASLFLAACAADPSEMSDLEDDPILGGKADQASGAIPVYYNHGYGLLSETTVTAVQESAYLGESFVDVEVRTTKSPGFEYTGTYLNMRDTYFELFPEGTFGYPIGVNGTALGDDAAGGIEQIVERWQDEFGDDGVALSTRSREVDGVQVPWFRIADLAWAAASEYTAHWAMEYVPNAGSQVPRTRREERATRYRPDLLAENVEAVILGIPDGDRENLRRSLKAVGWRVQRITSQRFVAVSPIDAGAARVIFAGPSAPGRIGVLGLLIRLNRVERHTEQLGDAVLEVGIGGLPYATLWFVPPSWADAVQLMSLAR